MKKIKLVALPVLCADVFDGTNEIRPGGEALNFSVHAAEFSEFDVTLLGVIGDDDYGKCIMSSIANKNINTKYVRVDKTHPTAHNTTYLTEKGDRYYKEDSWTGDVLENIVLDDAETKLICESDVVFIHFGASCFDQVLELRKKHKFKLAVDFDVNRDFDKMEQYAPYVDFFMISGKPELAVYFKAYSNQYDGLFNMSFGEIGSVTYHKGTEYRVTAKKVDNIIDTTGCGDSYHAGFVCSYMLSKDINAAMLTGSQIAANTLSHYGGFEF
ncbi:MAG: carbohydrate kinase [Clostridia bacterium]|nr:carbohydrate kinase [Clostridia bacterium]